jgi:hypothetical protein
MISFLPYSWLQRSLHETHLHHAPCAAPLPPHPHPRKIIQCSPWLDWTNPSPRKKAISSEL